VKKVVEIDNRAIREINTFDLEVKEKITAAFDALERDGFLYEPYAKRITKELFEIRVSHRGQWRVLSAYIAEKKIIILSAFHKKTQKTPEKEIKKAFKRLKQHI